MAHFCLSLEFWPRSLISYSLSHKYSLTQTDTQMRIGPLGANDSIILWLNIDWDLKTQELNG